MRLFNQQRLGIDLGTTNTLIYIDRKGIALRQPTIIAIDKETQKVEAYGEEAVALVGRVSERIQVVRPIQEGVINHYTLTKKLLGHYIKEAVHQPAHRPEVVICAPSKITKVERRALIDMLRELNISRAMIMDETVAIAHGLKININEPKAHMIVDIGGGTTSIGVMSYGELVYTDSHTGAGDTMDEAVQAWVRDHYQVIISKETACQLKEKIGNALYSHHDASDMMSVVGLDAIKRTPHRIDIHARIVAKGLDEVIQIISRSIKSALTELGPEMISDIMDEGIYLSGGGGLLLRLAERLSKEVGIKIQLVDAPLDMVVTGAGRMISDMQRQTKSAEKSTW